MYSYLLKKEINEETLLPCYFFHGQETFLAYQFINELKEVLISPDVQDYNIERFNLEDHSWMEIIDLARTIPFFLSSWRIVVVEVSKGKGENLSAVEESLLRDYLSSSSQTVMVIIFLGRIRKSASLFKLFLSFSTSLVCLKELKPLKERALFSWMDRKLLVLGMKVTFEAKRRLEELVGNDLRRVNNELEKLVTFVGEKKLIEIDDVNHVSGWVKTFFEWEIGENLEKINFKQSLIVLNRLFKEGVKPEYILGLFAKFFRDILLAKLWLKEKDKDRKAIFKELRPHIHEKFGSFYTVKFKEFFSLVESIPIRDLHHFLDELERIDLKIKTSDLFAQTLLESFLFDYCCLRKRDSTNWKESG